MTPEQEAEEMARAGLLGVGGSEVRRKVAERLRGAWARGRDAAVYVLENDPNNAWDWTDHDRELARVMAGEIKELALEPPR